MCTSRFGASHPWSNIAHKNHSAPLKSSFPKLNPVLIDEIMAVATKNTLTDVTGIIAILAACDAYGEAQQQQKQIPSVQFSFWQAKSGMSGIRYEVDEVSFVEEKFRDIMMAETVYHDIKHILKKHLGITLVAQCTCSFKPVHEEDENDFMNSPEYQSMQYVRQFMERNPLSEIKETTMATMPKCGLYASNDEIKLMNKIISLMLHFTENHMMAFDADRHDAFMHHRNQLQSHLTNHMVTA